MAKKQTAAVGLNIVSADGTETRYERGDTIPAKHVESWMLDDGVVVDGDLPAEIENPLDAADIASQRESIAALDEIAEVNTGMDDPFAERDDAINGASTEEAS